jgi:hypothetical protein
MDESNSIILRAWSSDTGHNEPTGQTIDVYTLARSLTIENFTTLLDDFLNLGGKGFREGKEIGLQLRFTHRTLQRLAVCFAFGMIAGLSEQEYTDPRNETAILTAKKIAQMLEKGDLPLGLYI